MPFSTHIKIDRGFFTKKRDNFKGYNLLMTWTEISTTNFAPSYFNAVKPFDNDWQSAIPGPNTDPSVGYTNGNIAHCTDDDGNLHFLYTDDASNVIIQVFDGQSWSLPQTIGKCATGNSYNSLHYYEGEIYAYFIDEDEFPVVWIKSTDTTIPLPTSADIRNSGTLIIGNLYDGNGATPPLEIEAPLPQCENQSGITLTAGLYYFRMFGEGSVRILGDTTDYTVSGDGDNCVVFETDGDVVDIVVDGQVHCIAIVEKDDLMVSDTHSTSGTSNFIIDKEGRFIFANFSSAYLEMCVSSDNGKSWRITSFWANGGEGVGGIGPYRSKFKIDLPFSVCLAVDSNNITYMIGTRLSDLSFERNIIFRIQSDTWEEVTEYEEVVEIEQRDNFIGMNYIITDNNKHHMLFIDTDLIHLINGESGWVANTIREDSEGLPYLNQVYAIKNRNGLELAFSLQDDGIIHGQFLDDQWTFSKPHTIHVSGSSSVLIGIYY